MTLFRTELRQMTRKQPPLPPETGYKEVAWAVFKAYENRNNVIVATSVESVQKYFSTEEQQQDHLDRFRRIHKFKAAKQRKSAALRFIEDFGFPVHAPDGIAVSEIIKASAYISFLYDIASELREEVHGLQSLLGVIPRGSLHDLEVKDLSRVLGISTETVVSRYGRVGPRAQVSAFTTIAVTPTPAWSDGVLPPSAYYDFEDWNARIRQGTAYESAAQTILKQAFDGLMNGVKPVFDWTPRPVGVGWELVPKLNCLCPWHAICLALYRHASGSSRFRRCPNPKCAKGSYLNTYRSDARNCGAGACRKWCSRNLERIRDPR